MDQPPNHGEMHFVSRVEGLRVLLADAEDALSHHEILAAALTAGHRDNALLAYTKVRQYLTTECARLEREMAFHAEKGRSSSN